MNQLSSFCTSGTSPSGGILASPCIDSPRGAFLDSLLDVSNIPSLLQREDLPLVLTPDVSRFIAGKKDLPLVCCKKKRGRPPKNVVAMTAAERMAALRKRRKKLQTFIAEFPRSLQRPMSQEESILYHYAVESDSIERRFLSKEITEDEALELWEKAYEPVEGLLSEKETAEYDDQLERAMYRAERGKDKGYYIADAPWGCGRLVFTSDSTLENIARNCQMDAYEGRERSVLTIPAHCKGHAPDKFGSFKVDRNKERAERAGQNAISGPSAWLLDYDKRKSSTWLDLEWRRGSSRTTKTVAVDPQKLVCCVLGCPNRPAEFHPEDVRKRLQDGPRFCCAKHLSEFRNKG